MKLNIKFGKSLILLSLFILLSACGRMVKEEPYLEAQQVKPLQEVEGLDLPQDTGQLAIPDIKTDNQALTGIAVPPPEMAFAKRRSSDENVVIIDADGVPTMELFNNKDAWQLMNGDFGEHWFIIDANEADCQVTLHYDDPINKMVDDQGFFKKLFTFKSRYIDRSGQYVLTCLKLPQKQQIWVQTLDFKAPSAFVVDDLFSHLFNAAIDDNS
ncbi:hypothetical protein [Marinicella gelatinilytica]|uniref:hypothetical protein n=1 Tax=Marinicella gelatinilytica TaxID=2996017 RepID=UPI00226086EE|nr:hypothetical protein [Marinicella gelatinilytica]MCX7545542.1 hypothetical protein [Marinicella gelatinilytica]